MRRKDLNKNIIYDGYMVSRYMDDLHRRHPRLMEALNLAFVCIVLSFAVYGVMSFLVMLKQI